MIDYDNFTLENGLRVLVHQDKTTPLAVMNILYNVGSRDEKEDKTGFAHLFEHLMFGGSQNIPSYDEPLQHVGGENNAFTSPDITNYYLTLPATNLETGFWLESDRMLSLSFDPQVLEVQRNVVIEEFKQRYLNQPYGDAWLKLRPLAYEVHPYKWATIGKDIDHIEKATMEDVRMFFNKFYLPNNAILVVAGNIEVEQVKSLAEKWFGPIARGEDYQRALKQEPPQHHARQLETTGRVPVNALYRAYHMPGRTSYDYYTVDLISDILGRGKSSRLYRALVKEEKLFNSMQAYVTGSADPGLLVITGKLNDDISFEQAEHRVDQLVNQLVAEGVGEEELRKVKNQAESSLLFGEVELLNRAMNLAYATFLGNTDRVNKEAEILAAITKEDVSKWAKNILSINNSSTLRYLAAS